MSISLSNPKPVSTRTRHLKYAALLAAISLVVSACGATGDQRPQWGAAGAAGAGSATGDYEPPSGEGLEERFAQLYQQQITWESCGDLECAKVTAPINWDDPNSATFELAISRSRATGGNPLGSLLINPGGPGGSGIEMLQSVVSMGRFTPRLLATYDVVGFDPRGVGQSHPVTCYTGQAKEDYVYTYYDMDTPEGVEQAEQAMRGYAEACAANTGELLEFVDTVSSSRDMDLLRAVLGDEKLNYLGFSYGTALGATYAHGFPQKVGRMVLDGAVDLNQEPGESSLSQMEGFELALRAFIEDCQQAGGCPLKGSVDDGIKQIQDLIAQVRKEPMVSGSGRELNATALIHGIVVPLYSQDNWVALNIALDMTLNQKNPEIFLILADAYFGRTGPGQFESNQSDAFTAVNCLDDGGQDMPQDEIDAFGAKMRELAPTFGWYFSHGKSECEYWAYPGKGGRFAPNAEGANTILVVGTTGDPATPYKHSQSMTKQLGSAVLLTYDGEGHTAYGSSNSCVDDAVDSYLIDGVLPAEGTVC